MPISLPTRINVNGRTTSLTNAFVNHITPRIHPSDDEIEGVLGILGQTSDNIACAYCGGPYQYWDHFRPLVEGRRPTGYITEINNLVPCCNTCNTSKGNKHWRVWIQGTAPKCPAKRAPSGLKERISLLERFESRTKPIKIDFEALVGRDLWARHWRNLDAVVQATQQSVDTANEIRRIAAAQNDATTNGNGRPSDQY